MGKLRIYISGQKRFAADVLRLCLERGHTVVGVCAPLGDGYLRPLAATHGIPVLPGGMLNADTMPEGVDLGISAHSFDYIGRLTRYRPRLGWIGYHPSLLPRHRGRSAVEWAVRMGDAITGGTVFWLNAGIDRGDIAYQDWCHVDPALRAMPPSEAAAALWRDELYPIGIRLIGTALADMESGKIVRAAQDSRFSTWEPGTAVNDIFRPDALMLEAAVPQNKNSF